MAFVEKLPSGKWRGGHWVKTYDGKRRKQWIGTFDRKTDAREAALEAEVKARRVAAAESGTASARMTWAQWWEIYFAKREFTSNAGANEQGYARRHLLPQWGEVPLNRIHRRPAQEWVDNLSRKGYAPSYISTVFGAFRASIKAAVVQDILSTNPLEGVRLPRIPRKAKTFTTLEELELMRPHLHPIYADAFEFLLETGLRPGELAGLHINRIDLDQGWLTVAEVYVDKRHLIRPAPKDGDVRSVPMTSKAIEIARRQISGRKLRVGCETPHVDGVDCQYDLLFRNAYGGVLRPGTVTHQLRNASLAAGIPIRGGYSGRRGFATRAASGGMDAFLLADVMGHADVRMTREYVQMGSDSRARALAALGEKTELSAVDDVGVGQHGTSRGTRPGNYPPRSTPKQEDGKVS